MQCSIISSSFSLAPIDAVCNWTPTKPSFCWSTNAAWPASRWLWVNSSRGNKTKMVSSTWSTHLKKPLAIKLKAEMMATNWWLPTHLPIWSRFIQHKEKNLCVHKISFQFAATICDRSFQLWKWCYIARHSVLDSVFSSYLWTGAVACQEKNNFGFHFFLSEQSNFCFPYRFIIIIMIRFCFRLVWSVFKIIAIPYLFKPTQTFCFLLVFRNTKKKKLINVQKKWWECVSVFPRFEFC